MLADRVRGGGRRTPARPPNWTAAQARVGCRREGRRDRAGSTRGTCMALPSRRSSRASRCCHPRRMQIADHNASRRAGDRPSAAEASAIEGFVSATNSASVSKRSRSTLACERAGERPAGGTRSSPCSRRRAILPATALRDTSSASPMALFDNPFARMAASRLTMSSVQVRCAGTTAPRSARRRRVRRSATIASCPRPSPGRCRD